MVRRLGLSFRDVDWTELGRPAATGCTSPHQHGERRRSSASTSTCPTPTCRWPRRCAPAGFGHRARVQHRAGCPADDCVTPAGAAPALAGVDGIVIPGGFGVRGIEGKIGAAQYARETRRAAARPVPRPAVHDDRGARATWSAWPAPTPRSSTPTPHPVIATMADQEDVVAGRGDLGGTMRLGRVPGDAARGVAGRRGVRRAPWSASATGTATR